MARRARGVGWESTHRAPGEPFARIQFDRRRALALAGGTAVAAFLAHYGINVLEHPNRGDKLPWRDPDKYFDGHLDLAPFSSLTNRDALDRIIPFTDGQYTLLQDWADPWGLKGAPETQSTLSGFGINSFQGKLFGVALVRESHLDVLDQGQLIERGLISRFGHCGPDKYWPSGERYMTLLSPLSVVADLRPFANQVMTADRQGFASTDFDFRWRTPPYLGSATPLILPSTTLIEPNSPVPISTTTNGGRVVQSPFNRVIITDTLSNGRVVRAQPVTVVGTLRATVGQWHQALIECPYVGSIEIYNPINDGKWEPKNLCVRIPTRRDGDTSQWVAGGPGKEAHTDSLGYVTLPLYHHHSRDLDPLFVVDRKHSNASAQDFFEWAGRNVWSNFSLDELMKFNYMLDWAVAEELATGNPLSGIPLSHLAGRLSPLTPPLPSQPVRDRMIFNPLPELNGQQIIGPSL